MVMVETAYPAIRTHKANETVTLISTTPITLPTRQTVIIMQTSAIPTAARVDDRNSRC